MPVPCAGSYRRKDKKKNRNIQSYSDFSSLLAALIASISATMSATSSSVGSLLAAFVSHGSGSRSVALLMPFFASSLPPTCAAIRLYVCQRVALQMSRCRRL